jgi:hypothetical protein
MTSKNGKGFSAYLQYSADKRSLQFRFDNERQVEQSPKQENWQTDVQRSFRGKELTEEQRNSLKEGKTVHMEGLIDKKGKGYSGYLTLNKETGKIDFMFPAQYREAAEKGLVIPDGRNKSQVTLHAEAKTGEVATNGKEPQQGLTPPPAKQVEKQVVRQEQGKPKKSVSMKI